MSEFYAAAEAQDWIDIAERYSEIHGSHDIKIDYTRILAVQDHALRELSTDDLPREWTSIAEGIECREAAKDTPKLRIHRHACPVRVQFEEVSHYVVPETPIHNSSNRHTVWREYRSTDANKPITSHSVPEVHRRRATDR